MSLPATHSHGFQSDGYLVVRGLADAALVSRMREYVQVALAPVLGLAEFEADLGYPGAPASREAPGGETPRRLLHAIARDEVFRHWATSAVLGDVIRTLPGFESGVCVSQSHHNCVMTKFPDFSSETLWHQDVRYWSFDRPHLVSAWLALGPEDDGNGALRLIRGSHLLDLDRGRLDAELFLRPELSENQRLIETAITAELQAGDVLFFDARLFHAAGANRTKAVKLSAVFTFHAPDNRPIPGTRSANHPSLPVG